MKPEALAESEVIGQDQIVATQEIHCQGCGRFLGYQAIVWGTIRIKCPTCKVWITLDINPPPGKLDKN